MDDIREDNLDAYKWILDSLNSTIGVRLDISKIAILGWSAGGTALFYLVRLPFPSLSDPLLITDTDARRPSSRSSRSDLPYTDIPQSRHERSRGTTD